MNPIIARLSQTARQAVRSGNWAAVNQCAREILKAERSNPEGWFLAGLVAKAAGRGTAAIDSFSRSIHYDPERYDAGIELAWQYWLAVRMSDALELLERYRSHLERSPLYLELAARTYTRLGLHDRAYPLYEKASILQPEIYRFREALAKCAVFVGKIDQARAIYRDILEKAPSHQRNHFELSRLDRAGDTKHLEQMQAVLEETALPPERNIFLYYAMAKELEDLERWDEAFDFYQRAGDAARSEARKAGYRVSQDVELIDGIREHCNAEWLARKAVFPEAGSNEKTPIFIVGLPRTGTTLTERIIASHSQVESADETQFMQIAIQRAAGKAPGSEMTPAVIRAAANTRMDRLGQAYLTSVDYKLGENPYFVDKMPENFLYLGFIAAALPQARIVHLRRHPMDACFAMYKQSFFRFAYTLDDIAEYYLAYDRLHRHWKEVLGDRIIEVGYEQLVTDQEAQTRRILEEMGLGFEAACLDFHLNTAPTATASAAQVREKAHTRSVGKWQNWKGQLQPLRERLDQAGIYTGQGRV